MCGIAGFQGEFPRELLGRMVARIAHRGPDGEGCVMVPVGRGATALGHRRLAIIDLSANGLQPMTTRCTCCGSARLEDLALTFNGEIYNFAELRRELVAAGHQFHSDTDSEVLLHLYASEGTAMLRRLNGIFAFAIHDGRPAGQREGMRPGDLFLARDQLGIKPLYYAETTDGLLFASEIKALIEHRGLSREIDLLALHQALAYLWTCAPRTALAAVKKLPPGYAMIVRDGAIASVWSYYDLPYGRPSLTGGEAEIAEALRERIRVAVERQLVADVPVGAFLSGGLDSSSVVAMMRVAQPGRTPRCYCIGFDPGVTIEGAPDDLPYARRVAAHLGVDLHPIIVGADIVRELERMLYLLDEPQADSSPINTLMIAEQARRDGIPVLLSGAGGDDIFSGYRRHVALQAESAWDWMPATARRGLARTARWVAGGRSNIPLGETMVRRALKAFTYADADGDRRLVSYFWWSPDEQRRVLYAPDVAATLRSADVADPMLATLGRIPDEHDRLNRLLYLEGKHFLVDHNLNFTDKMGMAAGVEIRVPLLDVDLVDYATRIPSAMKQRGLVGKAIFKKSMERDLPHDVIYRPKTGFGVPLRGWLRGELRPYVDEVLSADALRRRGLFDPAAVRRLIDLDRQRRVDGGYTVFSLLCIELWCRAFVDA